MKIYGLFKRSYDYHEWDDIVCVSESMELLTKEYESLDVSHVHPLIDESEHDDFRNNEGTHYAIVPIRSV